MILPLSKSGTSYLHTNAYIRKTKRAGEEDLPSPGVTSSAPQGLGPSAGRARVFQGGHFLDLHRMLQTSSGSEAKAFTNMLLYLFAEN